MGTTNPLPLPIPVPWVGPSGYFVGIPTPQLTVGRDPTNLITWSVDLNTSIERYSGIDKEVRADDTQFLSADGSQLYGEFAMVGAPPVPAFVATNAYIQNIYADVFVTDLRVKDKDIIVNHDGTDATAPGAGIIVEGTAGVLKGAVTLNAATDGWIIRPQLNYLLNSTEIIPTGNTTFNITGNSAINQNVQTTATPTFNGVLSTDPVTITEAAAAQLNLVNNGAVATALETDAAGHLVVTPSGAVTDFNSDINARAGAFSDPITVTEAAAAQLNLVNNGAVATALETDAAGDFNVTPASGDVNIYPTTELNVSGNVATAVTKTGGTLGYSVTNVDNTNVNSNAAIALTTGGAASGDPYVAYSTGVNTWSTGIDNTDGDAFKWNLSATPSSGSTMLSLDASGNFTVTTGDFALSVGTGVNEITTDVTLHGAGASDDRLATELAIKTYVDTTIASLEAYVYTVSVGGEYLTITDAINAAILDGPPSAAQPAVISIAPGVYNQVSEMFPITVPVYCHLIGRGNSAANSVIVSRTGGVAMFNLAGNNIVQGIYFTHDPTQTADFESMFTGSANAVIFDSCAFAATISNAFTYSAITTGDNATIRNCQFAMLADIDSAATTKRAICVRPAATGSTATYITNCVATYTAQRTGLGSQTLVWVDSNMAAATQLIAHDNTVRIDGSGDASGLATGIAYMWSNSGTAEISADSVTILGGGVINIAISAIPTVKIVGVVLTVMGGSTGNIGVLSAGTGNVELTGAQIDCVAPGGVANAYGVQINGTGTATIVGTDIATSGTVGGASYGVYVSAAGAANITSCSVVSSNASAYAIVTNNAAATASVTVSRTFGATAAYLQTLGTITGEFDDNTRFNLLRSGGSATYDMARLTYNAGYTTLTQSLTGDFTVAPTGGTTNITGQLITSSDAHVTARIATNIDGLSVANAEPHVYLYETDGAVNNRNWDVVATGEDLFIRAVADNNTSSAPALRVERTGVAIDATTLYGSNWVFLNSDTISAGQYDADTTIIEPKSEYSAALPNNIWSSLGATELRGGGYNGGAVNGAGDSTIGYALNLRAGGARSTGAAQVAGGLNLYGGRAYTANTTGGKITFNTTPTAGGAETEAANFSVAGFFGVGIASGTNADRRVEILDASNPQLRLSHTKTAQYTDFQTDAGGDLTITPSGGDTNIASNLSVLSGGRFAIIDSDVFTVGDGMAYATISAAITAANARVATASTPLVIAVYPRTYDQTTETFPLILRDYTHLIGIGNSVISVIISNANAQDTVQTAASATCLISGVYIVNTNTASGINAVTVAATSNATIANCRVSKTCNANTTNAAIALSAPNTVIVRDSVIAVSVNDTIGGGALSAISVTGASSHVTLTANQIDVSVTNGGGGAAFNATGVSVLSALDVRANGNTISVTSAAAGNTPTLRGYWVATANVAGTDRLALQSEHVIIGSTAGTMPTALGVAIDCGFTNTSTVAVSSADVYVATASVTDAAFRAYTGGGVVAYITGGKFEVPSKTAIYAQHNNDNVIVNGTTVISTTALSTTNTPVVSGNYADNAGLTHAFNVSSNTSAEDFRVTHTQHGGGTGYVSFTQSQNGDCGIVSNSADATIAIGRTTPGATGVAKFEVYGTTASIDGPHIQTVTSADIYPLTQILSFAHDDISIGFDAYYDGTWKSADAGTNFQIAKSADTFRINVARGIAQGAANNINTAYGLALNSTKVLTLYHDDDVTKLASFTVDGSGILTIAPSGGETAIVGTLNVDSIDEYTLGAGVDITGTGAITVNSTGGSIDIGTGADAGAINIGTSATARTITVGNAASTEVQANAALIDLNTVSAMVKGVNTRLLVWNPSSGGGDTASVDFKCSLVTADVRVKAGLIFVNGGIFETGSLYICNDVVGDDGNVDYTTDAKITLDNSGNVSLTPTAALSATAVTTIDLQAAGAFTIDSSGSTIGIGTDANTGAINIGTSATARAITVGNAASTAFEANAATIALNAGTGGVTVAGSYTAIESTNLAINDAHPYLNNGYTTVVAETGGLIVNYLPTVTVDTVAAPGFVAGIVATSNPTVGTVGAATFSIGNFVQISGANNVTNTGLFEVLSHAANLLTIRGVGLTATVEDFTQNQFIADATAVGTITKVNISVIRSGTDGIWETAYGSNSGLIFKDVTVITGSGVDEHVTRWDGVSAIQNSALIIDDAGNLTETTSITGATGSDFNIDAQGAQILNFGTVAAVGAINVGTSATARTITVGNAASTEFEANAALIDLNAGATGITVDSTGAIAFTIGTTVDIQAVNAITVDSSGSTIGVGTDANTGAINVGTSATARTITVGNAASTEFEANAALIDLNAGANGITVDSTGAIAFVIGTTADLQVTGAITIDSSGSTIGVGTDANAGAINVGTSATARTITVGNAASTEFEANAALIDLNAGATGITVDSTGAIAFTIGTTVDIQAVNAITVDSSGSTIGIGTDANVGAINVGTSATARIITVGNAASTEFEANAALIDLNAGANGITVDSTGAIAITSTQAAKGAVTLTANVATNESVLIGTGSRFSVDDSTELTVGAGMAFSTIAAAVTAAASGNVISVYPGTYAENVSLPANVSIIGVGNRVGEVTVTGYVAVNTNSTKFTIKNLTITYTTNDATPCIGFSAATSATCVIENCAINRTSTTDNVYAINLTMGTGGLSAINNSIITATMSSTSHFAVYFATGTHYINDSVVTLSSSGGTYGRPITVEGGTLNASNNYVTNTGSVTVASCYNIGLSASTSDSTANINGGRLVSQTSGSYNVPVISRGAGSVGTPITNLVNIHGVNIASSGASTSNCAIYIASGTDTYCTNTVRVEDSYCNVTGNLIDNDSGVTGTIKGCVFDESTTSLRPLSWSTASSGEVMRLYHRDYDAPATGLSTFTQYTDGRMYIETTHASPDIAIENAAIGYENSGGQSVNISSWTPVSFDTSLWSRTFAAPTGGTTFTAPSDGLYQISYSLYLTAASAGTSGRFSGAIYDVTTTKYWAESTVTVINDAIAHTISGSSTLNLSAGDTFQIFAYQTLWNPYTIGAAGAEANKITAIKIGTKI